MDFRLELFLNIINSEPYPSFKFGILDRKCIQPTELEPPLNTLM